MALGAALGVLATGLSGLSRLGAPSLLLFLLIVLSGTALIQGWILEGTVVSDTDVPSESNVDLEPLGKPESEMKPS